MGENKTMRRKRANLAKKITLALVTGAFVMSSSVALAGVNISTVPPADGWVSVDRNGDSVVDLYAPNGDRSNNTITISDGTVSVDLAGGYDNGPNDASGNKINIGAGTFGGNIFGAYVYSGGAEANTVAITAGTFDGDILGGCSYVGNATENTVDITAGTFGGNIVGGFSENATAAENTVTITAGTFNDDVIGGRSYGDTTGNAVMITDGTFDCGIVGGVSYEGNATGNTVTIADGIFNDEVLGGCSDAADATGNTVAITNGAFGEDAYIYGGYSYGDATGNAVTIADGTFDRGIVGGESYVGNATENTVNITAGTFNGYVYGGYSENATAAENTVTITDGTFDSDIVGGYSENADAAENTVTITAGTFNGWVCGGRSYGDTTGNAVMIADGTFDGDIYGGESYGDATGNTVDITAGTFNTGVFSGYSYEGDVTENTVTITAGTFNEDVIGGYSDAGDATDNTVAITNGTFGEYAYIYGGYSYGDATGNAVNIADGTFDGDIYGGESYEGNATENMVNITAGTFNGYVYGGYTDAADATENIVNIADGTFDSEIVGGVSYEGNATDNTVDITDGTFGDIIGGYSENADAAENTVTITAGTFNGRVCGGRSNEGNATDNTVTITGGTFDGDVYGGYSAMGDATGNTVTISGTADLENAQLFGGAALRRVDELSVIKAIRYEISGAYGGSSAPNTLNLGTSEYSWANLHNTGSNNIKTIQGFDIINFEHVKWDTENPALKVERLDMSGDGTTITVNNLYVEEGDATFVANANMTLIDSTETNGNLADASSVVTIHSGIANVYAADIVMGEEIEGAAEEDVFIVLGGEDTNHENVGEGTYPPDSNEGGDTPNIPTPSRNDQVLVLGESRAAAMAFTNQGSELIELAINNLVRDQEDEKVFAAVYGNHSEYETGSHVNVNGWSGIVGIGKTTNAGLTYGAFFENGIGDYSTHNIYTDDYIRGDGEAVYNGGGFLVRKDNTNGVYTEASVRAGNLSNELEGAVRNGQSLTGYDIDTFYYGAHIGVGKVIPKGKDSLDVYGKFIYTHHNGETFDIDGTDVKFDSMDSQRLRLGLRYNSAQTKKATLYYGAAWEYEFDGDANDKVATFDLETPSLEGSTVIGELGLHYIADARWSLDVNARGYTGQRDGVSGSVQVKYSF